MIGEIDPLEPVVRRPTSIFCHLATKHARPIFLFQSSVTTRSL